MRKLLSPLIVLVMVLALAYATLHAQATQEALFCVQSLPPLGDTHTVSINGATPIPLTLTSPPHASCSTTQGITHSFTLPASHFADKGGTIQIASTNSFGTHTNPVFTVGTIDPGLPPGGINVIIVITVQVTQGP